jgi:hypothetical protein
MKRGLGSGGLLSWGRGLDVTIFSDTCTVKGSDVKKMTDSSEQNRLMSDCMDEMNR